MNCFAGLYVGLAVLVFSHTLLSSELVLEVGFFSLIAVPHHSIDITKD